jgi:hypothetical protein
MNEALKDNDSLFVCDAMVYLGRIIGESITQHIYRLMWGDEVACDTPNGYHIHLRPLTPFSWENITDCSKVITGNDPGFFFGERVENVTTFQSVSHPGRYLGGTATNGVYLKPKSIGPKAETQTKDEDLMFTVQNKANKSSASDVYHTETIEEGQDDVDSATETNSTAGKWQLYRDLLFCHTLNYHRSHLVRILSRLRQDAVVFQW